MEIDSKPEVMDKLDRRMIQLQDRARGGEEGEGRGLAKAPGADRGRDRQAAARVSPTWKNLEGREGQAQGSAQVKEEIDKLKLQIEELQRKGDFNKVAELQYGKLPQLERS
jgi:ATP-dependent Clp protease ATP-binding subunit ClpB